MRVRWQVENDPYCRAVLRAHWPKVTLHTDVRRKIRYEPVDVVAGGFPCQPVSNAGLRLHDADPRWLWPQMLKVVKYVQPRWVLVENVEGLRTKGLCDVLEGLAECGYDAEWLRVPAAAVGAPHQRRRYFVVGYPSRGGREEGACVFREPTGFVDAANSVVPVANANGERRQEQDGASLAGKKKRARVGNDRETAANTDGTRQQSFAGNGTALQEEGGEGASRPARSRKVAANTRGVGLNGYENLEGKGRKKKVWREALGDARLGRLSRDGQTLANSGRKRRQQVATGPPRDEEANGWRSQDWGDYEPAVRRWEAISGRPSPQPLVRRVDDGLSRGMALGTLTDELKALGNAVVPQVAEYVGRCIVAADREMYGA